MAWPILSGALCKHNPMVHQYDTQNTNTWKNQNYKQSYFTVMDATLHTSISRSLVVTRYKGYIILPDRERFVTFQLQAERDRYQPVRAKNDRESRQIRGPDLIYDHVCFMWMTIFAFFWPGIFAWRNSCDFPDIPVSPQKIPTKPHIPNISNGHKSIIFQTS